MLILNLTHSIVHCMRVRSRRATTCFSGAANTTLITVAGQELIAHELTHVLQQNGGASGKKDLSLKRSTSSVIQRGVLSYLKGKFGSLLGYADEQRGEFKVDVEGEYGNKENKKGEQYRRPNYNEDRAPDVANYILLGGSGGTAAGKAITDRVQVVKTGADFFTDSTPLMSGVGQGLSTAGAVSAGVGTIPAAVDAYKGLKEWRDKGNTKAQRDLALGFGASGLGNVAQQTATTVFHTANRYGSTAVAAGAEVATGGAAVLTGAVDIARGAYAISKAKQNIKRLQQLQSGQSNVLIPKAAKQAQSTQKLRQDSAAFTIGKGVLTAIGGAMLLASATTPVGWLLIGVGALVGLKGAYNKWRDKKKRREAIVSDLLGVSEAQKTWRKKLEALEGPWYKPWKSRSNRKEIEAHGPSPIEKELKKKDEGFVSIDHYYSNYISKTADDLHDLGVSSRKDLEARASRRIAKWSRRRKKLNPGIIERLKSMSFVQIYNVHNCSRLAGHIYGSVVKLLTSMGLTPNFGKEPPEPTAAKIGKALHE